MGTQGECIMSDEEFDSFSDDLGDVIPDALVTDTYLCNLEEVKRIEAKDKVKYNVFEWEVIQEGVYEGETFSEMYRHATLAEYSIADKKEQREIREARRKFQARLISLGVPENEMGTVKPSSLVGLKAHVTVNVKPRTKGPGFSIWVQGVEVADLSKETTELTF
jgi:hypothetical protein